MSHSPNYAQNPRYWLHTQILTWRCALRGVATATSSSWILRTGGAPLLSLGVVTTGCRAEPPPPPPPPKKKQAINNNQLKFRVHLCVWVAPCWPRTELVDSKTGVARLKARGCGLAGAGRSPIRKPGRNWAPEVGLGEVGEPRVIGSVPTETQGQVKCSQITSTTNLNLLYDEGDIHKYLLVTVKNSKLTKKVTLVVKWFVLDLTQQW